MHQIFSKFVLIQSGSLYQKHRSWFWWTCNCCKTWKWIHHRSRHGNLLGTFGNKTWFSQVYTDSEVAWNSDVMDSAFFFLQIIIGIGAKPAVSPFERVGINTTVGGIQVCVHACKFECWIICAYVEKILKCCAWSNFICHKKFRVLQPGYSDGQPLFSTF